MIRGRNARNKRSKSEDTPVNEGYGKNPGMKKKTAGQAAAGLAVGTRGATSAEYSAEREAAMARARAAREAEKSRSYKGEEKNVLRDSEGKAVLSGSGSTIRTGGDDTDFYKKGGKVRGSGCCKRTKKCKMY